MSVSSAHVPSSTRSSGRSATPRSTEDRAAKVRFRRALSLMALTLVLPGSAQLIAGNKRVGRWAVRISLTLVGLGVGAVLTAYFWHGFAFWLGTTLWVLTWVRLLLIALAIGWAALFVDAWRLGRPLSLRLSHRRWAVLANGALALTVAAGLLFGAHLVGVHRGMIQAMFTGSTAADATDGRYNVLLIGADAGKSRWGLRTDSLTVASIDAETGRTVLIGLPRNMTNFPFPEGSEMAEQFPRGFGCETCYLYGVSTWVKDHPEVFKGSKTREVDGTVSAAEGITGLDISYWAMVDLQGFRDIVDAVGGVTINVREPIPVGGLGEDVTGYIEPGVQELSGNELLWYARSRDSSDDYSRMARQKCVMNAMLHQLSPTDVVRHYQALADATGSTVTTSIPPSEVGRFVDLALKAKERKVSTVSLVPPLIDTSDPNMDKVHSTIEKAIDRAEGSGDGGDSKKSGGAHAKAKKAKKRGLMTGGSFGSIDKGYLANQASDLGNAC